MVTQQKTTLAEFEAFIGTVGNKDRRFELVNGEIVEKMPTELHGIIAATITAILWNFVMQHKLGRVAVEPRHRVSTEDTLNSRIPDVAFTSAERALPITETGSVPQLPDLAVEIKSPDDTYKQLREKAAFYIENGVQMVWLVYPEKKIVEIYQPDADIQILTAEDTINGGTLLPDFEFQVNSIFPE